jgi:RNA polymerase sigma-70 factor (ECF subfamily)
MTHRAAEDVDLIGRYLRGDLGAFDELMRAHQDRVFGICLRMLRDREAALKRRHADSLPEGMDPPDPRAADPLLAAELRPDVEDALEQIPQEFRSAVVLVDLQGLAIDQAAEVLGVPSGTIKSRVHRGRRLLAEILGNHRDPSRHLIDGSQDEPRPLRATEDPQLGTN